MKNILLFCGIVTIVGLSGCTTFKNKYNGSNGSSIKKQDSSANLVSNPKSSLKLEYKKNTHEIDAKIITNWNGAPQGTIYLTWYTPKNTGCYGTSFPITKYRDAKSLNRDAQSVLRNGKLCEGKWRVEVTYKTTSTTKLAEQTIVVK